MPKYALKIEYDGQPFHGWQRQTSLPSVQGAIESALAKLERNIPTIAAAGRTDKGVHAVGQIAHCEMAKEWDPFRLSEALNFHLKPLPIGILAVAQAPDSFHARFSAKARQYHFKLLSRRAPVAHRGGLVWQVHHPLDVSAMRAGAQYLLGQHDFTTFRASECQAKSPVKTLDQLDITEHPVPYGMEYHFTVRARSFLHNQVRSFVGTLERVGSGAWQPIDVRHALEARDRSRCGHVCPPQGLYLEHVEYDEDPFAAIIA